uniref:ARAD1A16192p n=1 Tax=Blastobotrys adeninivorans TaxID=409370 RepID=A0A060SZ13_BLAAD
MDFCVVEKPKKRRNRKGKQSTIPRTVDDFLADFDSKKAILGRSKFYSLLEESLEEYKVQPDSIRCLAIGSPCDTSSTMPAMYQLALLMLLKEKLEIDSDKVTVYDPVFTDMDKEIFAKLGLSIDDSDDSKYPENCLLYMPHAPVSLIDSVLGNLEGRPWIIGNVISQYDTRISSEDLEQKYPHLKRALNDSWDTVTIPEKFIRNEHYFVAVNDTAMYRRGQGLQNNKTQHNEASTLSDESTA